MRLGPGPVFIYEWLTTTRRWQLYALRALFVGAILVVLSLTWSQVHRDHGSREIVTLAELAEYGTSVYFSIVLVELTLVLLAAPAATAGAVCLDKARGTLDHVLATDLSNAEIVLGKLGVRLIPVLGLVACVVPVVALAGLLGGIDPLALLGSFLVSIGCAVVGCSLALALSVWARKTHEVVMMTYIGIILWLIFPGLVVAVLYLRGNTLRGPPPHWDAICSTNPYYLVSVPYSDPTKVDVWTFLAFLGACLATGGSLVGLSIVRIRRVALRQAGQPASGWRLWRLPRLRRPSWLPGLPGPSLDFNPVAWREWHRMRPSGLMRIIWGVYAALGVLWLAVELNMSPPLKNNPEPIALMAGFQVALGLLLLSVGAATSLAEERVRGSLDILLSTPMSTRSILAGKWWGTFRKVVPVVFWPGLVTVRLLVEDGNAFAYLLLIGSILASGAAITSLGLAMATWVSRLGRSVALCVTAYAVISIGWPMLVASLFTPDPGRPLVMWSPAVGAFMETALISPDSFLSRDAPAAYGLAASIWILIDLAAAAVLYVMTLGTFDRRLGRMAESGGRPDSIPRDEPLAELVFDH